jgi:uncharacterized membrane protein YvbJ
MKTCQSCGKQRNEDDFIGQVCGWCDKLSFVAEVEISGD